MAVRDDAFSSSGKVSENLHRPTDGRNATEYFKVYLLIKKNLNTKIGTCLL